ncbi:hypothetical protein JA1_001216 [Spathaspora sp. JA1]|nr:hypothetical protein JA1_001216 [Spathaspora sp. JA1]
MHDFELLVTQCGELIENSRQVNIELSYLRWFLGYLILLQQEEDKEKENSKTTSLSNLLGFIFLFIDDLNQEQFSDITVELLTRTIQCVVGLLIRIKENQKDQEVAILQIGTFKPSMFMKEHIIPKINNVIDELHKRLTHKTRLIKLSKLWKFHLTFIGNDTKNNNSINYAKIHAQVPGFIQDRCPVIHEEQQHEHAQQQPIQQQFTRCPISQITSPQELEIDTKPPATATSRKRKCPFDHNNVKSSPSPFIESNLRSEKCPYSGATPTTTTTPDPIVVVAPPAPPPPPPPVPEPTMMIPEPLNDVIIDQFEDMFDFSQFGDLDLDFLINENFNVVI